MRELEVVLPEACPLVLTKQALFAMGLRKDGLAGTCMCSENLELE